MSALTPDEEAELAALTRALFARGATPSSAEQSRYAELETRRRSMRNTKAQPAEPSHEPAAMVPEPALAVVPARPPAPHPSPKSETVPSPPPSLGNAPGGPAAPMPSDRFAAIPEFGSLLAEAEQKQAQQQIAHQKQSQRPGAVVNSSSERVHTIVARPKRQPRSRQYSTRARIGSMALGAGIVALIVGTVAVVQTASKPRPVAVGTAVKTTFDAMPDLGAIGAEIVSSQRDNTDAMYEVEGIEGYSIVVIEISDDDQCLYLWAPESEYAESIMATCGSRHGPLVLDYSVDYLLGPPGSEGFDIDSFHRLIFRDGSAAVWEDVDLDWADYQW